MRISRIQRNRGSSQAWPWDLLLQLRDGRSSFLLKYLLNESSVSRVRLPKVQRDNDQPGRGRQEDFRTEETVEVDLGGGILALYLFVTFCGV